MFNFIKLFIVFIITLSPYSLLAHPGHGGHSSDSILHYIATPTHLTPLLLLAGIGIYFMVRKIQKNIDKEKIK